MTRFELSEVVAALSHALDLTEGQPAGHAGRTCMIGMRLAAEAGVDEADRAALFYALLLKDSGCSSSAARISSLFGGDDIALKRAGKLLDWTRPTETIGYVARGVNAPSRLARARRTLVVALELARHDGIVDARCERGAAIVRDLGFPPAAAEVVRSLDEHWDGHGKPRRLRGEEIPLLARIACLAQTVDVFFTAAGLAAARETVRQRRGRWFDPHLADLLLAIPADDSLWVDLAAGADPRAVAAVEPAGLRAAAGEDRVDRLAEAFAQVIDAKSAYTYDHSLGVARHAAAIAHALGLPPETCRSLRRAALLHDIGKLGVSTAILDKPGRLTAEEYAAVREHPRHTEEILARVEAFAPIAAIAGGHHERLDGRGYHRGLAGDDVPLGARVLAVADVYEALTADRPYREGMSRGRALAILRAEAGVALDGDVVDAHEAALDEVAAPAPPAVLDRAA